MKSTIGYNWMLIKMLTNRLKPAIIYRRIEDKIRQVSFLASFINLKFEIVYEKGVVCLYRGLCDIEETADAYYVNLTCVRAKGDPIPRVKIRKVDLLMPLPGGFDGFDIGDS